MVKGEQMAEITVKKIPSHVVYKAEYDIRGISDFFNLETGENYLYDLQYLMEAENPAVNVPDFDNDYNYFEYPYGRNGDGTIHVVYRDMVDRMGRDNAKGSYVFEEMPEIKAAVLEHTGSFDSVGEGFEKVYEWIRENGYEIAGKGRISAIHGPWDRDNENEYVNECQVPVKAAE